MVTTEIVGENRIYSFKSIPQLNSKLRIYIECFLETILAKITRQTINKFGAILVCSKQISRLNLSVKSMLKFCTLLTMILVKICSIAVSISPTSFNFISSVVCSVILRDGILIESTTCDAGAIFGNDLPIRFISVGTLKLNTIALKSTHCFYLLREQT